MYCKEKRRGDGIWAFVIAMTHWKNTHWGGILKHECALPEMPISKSRVSKAADGSSKIINEDWVEALAALSCPRATSVHCYITASRNERCSEQVKQQLSEELITVRTQNSGTTEILSIIRTWHAHVGSKVWHISKQNGCGGRKILQCQGWVLKPDHWINHSISYHYQA